jgi:hypothetical protein
VRVYPALRTGEEQQIFLARSRQIELQLRRAQQRGLGRDFESLRDYREGDDLRDICWTATARRGSLITRQYQTERSQPVWIVLDCGRLMRARVASGTKLQSSGAAPINPERIFNDAESHPSRNNKNAARVGHTAPSTPSSTTPAPRLLRWLNWRSTPATGWDCWPMGRTFSSGFCPGAARPTCGRLIELLAQVAPNPARPTT